MSHSSYNRSSNAYNYDYGPSYKENPRPVVPVSVGKRDEIVRNNRKRANRMNFLVVFKIAVGAVLLVSACCTLVYFYTSMNYLKRTIAKKENEYNVLVRENKDFKNELVKNIDISEIKRKAKKLGMKNAKKKDIHYYVTCCEEFVIQIEEFPKE